MRGAHMVYVTVGYSGPSDCCEDLYKKTMSADALPGREPYGITTRMMHCEGWQRTALGRPIVSRPIAWTLEARCCQR